MIKMILLESPAVATMIIIFVLSYLLS